MTKKKREENLVIIVEGKYYNDVREDQKCKHPSKDIMARFRRVYAEDGSWIVLWTWRE